MTKSTINSKEKLDYFSYEDFEVDDISIIPVDYKITTWLKSGQTIHIGIGHNNKLNQIDSIKLENKLYYTKFDTLNVDRFNYSNSGIMKTVGIITVN